MTIKKLQNNNLIYVCIALTMIVLSCSKADESILGCMDETACNYNHLAIDDDGSCIIPDESLCQSCADEALITSDVDEDGVCDDDEIEGCTNSIACNYDSTATEDDDSCLIPDGTNCEYCDGETVATSADCNVLYSTDTQTYDLTVPEYNGSAVVAINFDTQDLSYNIGTVGREGVDFKGKTGHSCGTPAKIRAREELSLHKYEYKDSGSCAVPSEQNGTQLIYETANFFVYIEQDQTDATKEMVMAIIDRFEATALLNFQSWWDIFYDVETYGKLNVYFIPDTGYLGYVTYQSQYCYFVTMDLTEALASNNSDNDLTMAHEFTHVLQYYLYDYLNQEQRYKLWITEGIAEASGVLAAEIDCSISNTCSMDSNYNLSLGYGLFGTSVDTAYRNAPQFFEYLRIQHGLTGKYHYDFMYEVESEALITSANNVYSSDMDINIDILTTAHHSILAEESVSHNFTNMYEAIVYFNLAKVIGEDNVEMYGTKFGYNGNYDQSWLYESSGSGTLEQSGALFFGSTLPQISITESTDKLYYYKINYSE